MNYDKALIFEAKQANPATDRIIRRSDAGTMTIVAVPDVADIPEVARKLADQGVRLIELCGGVSPAWRSRTTKAVGRRASVSSATFGIESLQAATHFNEAFSNGTATKQVFILLEPGANPVDDEVVLASDPVPTHLIPVPDEDTAARITDELATEGVLLIELYGGFSTGGIEKVIDAANGRSAVGAGSFALDAVTFAD